MNKKTIIEEQHGLKSYFSPSLPIPPHIHCISTYRQGGMSKPPYDSNNLGYHVGDDPTDVHNNRVSLPSEYPIAWLNQVHGDNIVLADSIIGNKLLPDADASYTAHAKVVCAVMTADCLPVILIDYQNNKIAAIHCGWRSLVQNIITKTILKMQADVTTTLAWLGPCIGPTQFEVGAEVKSAFEHNFIDNQNAFKPQLNSGDKYLFDLQWVARRELSQLGVTHISQDPRCTVENPELFFSYRRQSQTGRMVSMVWMD